MEQQFDKYRTGKASTEEVERITEKLLEKKFNEELRQKMALQLAREKGIRRNPKPGLRIVLRWSLSAAAAVLLLVGGWAWLTPTPTDYLALADSYLASPHANSETRKGEQDIVELEATATARYNNQEFTEAAIYYEQLQKQESPVQPLTTFYLGLSYLYQTPAKLDDAITNLRRVTTMPDSRLADEADWYLSLALVKAQQLEEAKTRLQKRAQNSAWQSDKAQLILESLP